MAQIPIPTPKRGNNKVKGEFYPLQKEELIALRKAKLINNTAFVHLALRIENPFCDRPVEIIPKEFALRWAIPESSVYEAIAKLKQLGTLKIKTGKVVIEWTHSQQDGDSEIPEFLRDPRMDSEIPENFPRTQNEFRDPRRDSESSENQPPKDLLNKALSFSQTIQTNQTFQTLQTEGKGEKNDEDETSTSDQSKSDSSTSPLEEGKSEANENQNKSDCSIALVVEKIPRTVIRHKTKIISTLKNIPSDLQSKLEELSIPLDKAVLRAITAHHLSQAYGALLHVENTWGTIKNPRSVFLHQISKQPVETMPQPLSEEFLMWYQIAVAERVVENLPPKHLSRDRYNEPLVRLAKPDPRTGAPYRLVEWRRVQVEPDLDPDRGMASATDLSSFFKQNQGKDGEK